MGLPRGMTHPGKDWYHRGHLLDQDPIQLGANWAGGLAKPGGKSGKKQSPEVQGYRPQATTSDYEVLTLPTRAS